MAENADHVLNIVIATRCAGPLPVLCPCVRRPAARPARARLGARGEKPPSLLSASLQLLRLPPPPLPLRNALLLHRCAAAPLIYIAAQLLREQDGHALERHAHDSIL